MAIVEIPKCHCQCDNYCNSATSSYLPGHDARHAGRLGRALARQWFDAETDPNSEYGAQLAEATLRPLSNLLKAKALGVARKSHAKALRYAQRAGRTAKAKVVTPDPTPGTVKVGRWTYAALRYSDGLVTRADKRNSPNPTWIRTNETVAATFVAD